MQEFLGRILTINLIGTSVVFFVAARIYLVPKLPELNPRRVLLPILLLHSLRHLGLMFLTAGATYSGMPHAFSYPAAIGDLVTSLLAFACLPAVIAGSKSARAMVWAFNIFGTLDLFLAITLATLYHAADYMGAAYWIPAFWVPALLVTHYLTFVILRRPWA